MFNFITFTGALFAVGLLGFTSVLLLAQQHEDVAAGKANTNPQTPLIIAGVVGLYPYAGVLFLISKNIVIVNSEELTVAIFMLLHYGIVTLLYLLWETNILGLRDLVIKALGSIGRYICQKIDTFIDKNAQRTNNEDNNQQ